MSEKSLFFDSIGGDRKYNSSDFTSYFKRVLTNGVFPNPSNNLQVLSNGDLTLTIKAGGANIDGYLYALTADKVLTISTPNPVADRNDLIVVRWDLTNRNISILIKENTTTIERTSVIYELALAQILVKKGTASIAQADITDTRQDTNKCGLINSLIQADTTTLFNQFQDGYNTWLSNNANEFEAWFETIKGQLEGDVAANLAGEIATLKQNKVDKNNYVANNGYAVTTGTSTSYIATLNPVPSAYVDGMQITILPHTDSGATPTLDINGLGASIIVKNDGSAISAGDIKANIPLSLVRVGSNFFIRSSGASKKFSYLASTNTIIYMLINYDDNYSYYSYYSTNRVYKVDNKTGSVLKTSSAITSGRYPFYADDNYIYVFYNNGSGSFSIIKFSWTATTIATKSYTLPYAASSFNAGVDLKENLLYVNIYNGNSNRGEVYTVPFDFTTTTLTLYAYNTYLYPTSTPTDNLHINYKGVFKGWITNGWVYDKQLTNRYHYTAPTSIAYLTT